MALLFDAFRSSSRNLKGRRRTCGEAPMRKIRDSRRMIQGPARRAEADTAASGSKSQAVARRPKRQDSLISSRRGPDVAPADPERDADARGATRTMAGVTPT